MDTQLVLTHNVKLIPNDADKHTRYRLGKFQEWLGTTGDKWYQPDLVAYRSHLLDNYAPSTARAHLSTIRARYDALARDNVLRDTLYRMADEIAGNGSDRKAFVDEVIERMKNAADPKHTSVKVKVRQDRPDSDQLRLSSEQASALLAAPGVDTNQDLRDTAVIALMLCTGVREAELSAVDINDLRQRLGGELALHVRDGKGCRERLIPYGELSWVLAIIDSWLDKAGIETGPVFRGLYKGGNKLRPGPLSVRAIEYILVSYPIMVDGELTAVKPHDCRRTYARLLYEAGVDLVAIQQNLGHSDIKTTLGYIGELDADRRRAPGIYSFDLSRLNGWRSMLM